MSKTKIFTQLEIEILKQSFRLEPATGVIRHLTDSPSKRIGSRGGVRCVGFYFKTGDVVSEYTTDTGYPCIRCTLGSMKINVKKHILVWILHHGYQTKAAIDHKDRDKFNCLPSNLREADESLNGANKNKYKDNATSDFKGVCWDKARQKWKAEIKVMGKRIHLGRFSSETEAAQAYNVGALKHFKEFACLNEV